MANLIPPMLVEIQLETAKIKQGLNEVNASLNNFGETVKKQGGFLEKFKATAIGVFGGNLITQGMMGVEAAFKSAIADADAYERALAKTSAIIESTGNVAGVSVGHFKAMASSLEDITTIDENLILQSMNVMATFTQVRNSVGAGNDIFDQATKAALDLSTVMEGDLQGATLQLGKALNDPVKGVAALQRVGVTFNASQKATIKTLVESNDVLGAQKIILAEVNREFGGAGKAVGDTFAGAVFRAKDKVGDFTRDLVRNLEPILLKIGKVIGDLINDYIKPFVNILIKNKEAVVTFVAILGTAFIAFKAYRAAMALMTAIQELYIVGLALAKGAKLADIAATEGQTGAMVLLNAVMNANPIAKIVTLIAALAAGFVIAWNHSETFRQVMINVGKAGIIAIGYLIEWVGKLVVAIIKLESGPLRLLLKGLALLHVPGAKEALKGIEGAIDSVGNFFDSTSKKVKSYADNLDALKNKKFSIPGLGGTTEADTSGGGKAPSSGATEAQLKAAAALVKANEKANVGYLKDVASFNDKIITATNNFHEKMASIDKDYNSKVAKLNADASKKIAELDSKYKEDRLKVTDDFNVAIGKLNKKRFEDEAKLSLDNEKKKADIIKAGYEKLISIVQSSIDRLRNAFAQGTAFNVGDIFKGLVEAGTASADELLKSMQTKLEASKTLMANAAALQAQGFSQTFIEQVVAQGPDVGNKLADSLKNATPETIKALQDTYKEMEATTNHGLDALGAAMNTGGKLATDELTKAYVQAQKDTADALIEQAKSYSEAQAEIAKGFDEAMAEASKTRDDALANLAKDYDTALAGINADLTDSLKTAYEDMVAAQDEAKKALSDSLDSIEKDFTDKLGSIKNATDATTSAINGMVVALNNARALASMPMPTPAAAAYSNAPAYNPLNGNSFVDATGSSTGSPITINQSITNTTPDASATLSATVSAIKFGTSITVPASFAKAGGW